MSLAYLEVFLFVSIPLKILFTPPEQSLMTEAKSVVIRSLFSNSLIIPFKFTFFVKSLYLSLCKIFILLACLSHFCVILYSIFFSGLFFEVCLPGILQTFAGVLNFHYWKKLEETCRMILFASGTLSGFFYMFRILDNFHRVVGLDFKH